jgi:hypothetical protein
MIKLIGLAAIATILSVTGAEARHRPANETPYNGIQRLSPTVDRDGWRLTPHGWDHSCFDIGPAMYACSENGG